MVDRCRDHGRELFDLSRALFRAQDECDRAAFEAWFPELVALTTARTAGMRDALEYAFWTSR